MASKAARSYYCGLEVLLYSYVMTMKRDLFDRGLSIAIMTV